MAIQELCHSSEVSLPRHKGWSGVLNCSHFNLRHT